MKPTALKEKRLSNGLFLIHLHTQNDPISACHMMIPNGTDLEPANKAGMTFLMWSLLTKGTDKRNARQIAEDIESIGASIGAGATHDYSEVSCHSVSDYFLPAMEIMAELMFRPAFHEAQMEKERAALMAGIRSKKESIFTVANEKLNEKLYGAHPYARASSGTIESVSRISAKDMAPWHKRIVIPNNAILSVASNLPFEKICADVERLFGASAWKKVPGAKKQPYIKTPALKTSHAIRTNEKFEQAYILIGYPAPPVQSKEYVALKLLNALLGGGMSTRLFQQLREQEGLAYDVGAFYASKKCGSAFVVYMGLQLSRLEEAKKRILAVLAEIINKPVPKKELEETKNFVKGTYILDHQTNSQRAHYLGWWKILGLGSAFDNKYISMVDRVGVSDIRKVAKKILGGKSITVEVIPEKKLA